MKKIIILIITYCLFSFNCYSQGGRIEYEAEMIIGKLKDIENSNISKEAKSLLISSFKNQNKVKYILKFNKKESSFKKTEKLKVGKEKFDLADIQGGKGVYYSNKNLKKILNQKEFSEQLFLINIPQYTWKLSQERKKIGNYICYKASTTKEIETRRGFTTRKITAWYTSELPYNFGPKDYNGLPGLILELQEDSLLFKAVKINLYQKKQIKIKEPIKGKKVSIKEYDSLVKKMVTSHWRYKQ